MHDLDFDMLENPAFIGKVETVRRAPAGSISAKSLRILGRSQK